MHTFFVNTSSAVDPARHHFLFDYLDSFDQIKCFNYPLDELSECAAQIADIITHDEKISELYNIIVYAEIPERNETALATEWIISMKIEEQLFSELYALGRKPTEALVLFGENFTRDYEYGSGDTYRHELLSSLWSKFPLPDQERAIEIIQTVRKAHPNGPDRVYQTALYVALTAEANEEAMLSADSEFVIASIYQLADSLKRDDLSKTDLFSELFNVIRNQSSGVQKQHTGKKVRYAHVRLLDSDLNVRNRAEYQILLFVCLCAQGEIKLVKGSYEHEYALGSETIPKVDWNTLASVLKSRKKEFEDVRSSLNTSVEPIYMFKEQLFDEKAIIKSPVEPLDLNLKVNPNRGLTVKQLKNASDETIKDIEEKNRLVATRIGSYITKVTTIFSDDKDEKFKHIKYFDETKRIENDQLTADFIKKQLDAADGKIASRRRLTASTAKLDELLQASKKRLGYFFDCLKKGLLLYIIGVIFTILFAIPYAIMQQAVFTVVHGWIFYFGTIGAVVASFTAGYLIFEAIFKSRIRKELSLLCNQFTFSQDSNRQCLEEFDQMICHDIPLSFCLRTYEMNFKAYLAQKRLMPVVVTYHSKLLKQYIQYIQNILSELDIAQLGEEPKQDVTTEMTVTSDTDIFYQIVDEITIVECFANMKEAQYND